jgi:hypothetical protein
MRNAAARRGWIRREVGVPVRLRAAAESSSLHDGFSVIGDDGRPRQVAMQIPKILTGQAGPSAFNYPGGVAAATAALNDPQGDPAQQLKAYQALAGRWRESGPAARASLAQTLTETPFGQKVQSTLNAFTRAAWAGPDAVPPAPQARMLKAFDGLSETDRQIVAAMQVDSSGLPAFASAAEYRASLKAELDAASAVEPVRAGDTVTLSAAAQASLAGAAPPAADAPGAGEVSAHPEVAAAISAYAKAAG